MLITFPVSVLCTWSIRCILLCLKIVFNSSRDEQIIGGRSLGGTIFCATVPWYWSVLSVELPSCHITGVWNFKVPSRFLETLCILEWHYSKSSFCHITCILSKLIFNILTFWMVQYSCCHTWKFTIFAVMLYISSKYWHFNVWKIRMDLFFTYINYTFIKNYKFPLVHTMCFICSNFNIVRIIYHFERWSKMAVKICN